MVDGRLGDFTSDPHEDCSDDEYEDDASRDTKNLQLGVLLQEAGGVKHSDEKSQSISPMIMRHWESLLLSLESYATNALSC